MPFDRPAPRTFLMERESKELVPLDVKISGNLTTDYTVACKPHGVRPVAGDFLPPAVVGSRSGYIANGPSLSGPGLYNIFVIFNVAPEDPEWLAAILRLT